MSDASTSDDPKNDPFDADPAIELDDVSVSLGGQQILDAISAEIGDGTFVGLIGPNGAGKTTLLRTLNGALTPERGTVKITGEDIHALSSKAASRLVATVPQTTSVTFDFPVREVVKMGRTPHRGRFDGWSAADEAAVERAMERTTITALEDRPVTEVSGGERQRVLIARALAQKTPVLLLDEPTASLDINHQVRTLELVSDLVADGTTAVAAIHDLNLAAHYCDALVLLSGGRILSAGDPEMVLTESNLQTAFDAEAVVSRHPVTGSVYVTALPQSSDDASGRVHVVGGGGTGARALHVLSAAGYALSAGVLNEGDTDAEAARRVGADLATVPPYAPVDDAAQAALESNIEAADVTVVADVEVGEGNLANLEAATAAEYLVLVEERPFSERNYAGDAGRAVYERLRDRGHVVSSSELLSTVGELACESFRERSGEMKDDTDTSDVEGDADETDSGFDDSPYHSNQS
ncbi:heme ABC transporter ATP-binding protein [Haloferax mediterranei ATCC 33500]|uniref:Cobalamin import ATP-binding protein BtuD n=1 Tax=Haloferax mediterranei (strain ATCC 33500 / DSM 1411 / JCM 8866 / NBRC 14739 / NCIMB 2177 / R-4) TaxID=523841 RepID=I3R3M6_HALMT|nr:heme ABC transporter ATP-binding protein [Haloferax mediterranei]AFK18836.1 ABC-type cobalamin/Fe(III)-siderophore transport system, ATPase component [Haloferax mediterranei ATCC 33500]AHZ21798.1 corrinoid ABC transporter ATPase [Haloferax mediterranei ATCC 33500]EMA03305.1 ABC-type cobalamin/Fe(III)-siderophore transport system, ATPase component [Haloferax mediterranei ATCC 33500]MDX5988930.1 heme ABC transporter ATP-binding protein [Haloferax mediterranei ATCC 33500]QCQ75326.1 heme ABC tr